MSIYTYIPLFKYNKIRKLASKRPRDRHGRKKGERKLNENQKIPTFSNNIKLNAIHVDMGETTVLGGALHIIGSSCCLLFSF